MPANRPATSLPLGELGAAVRSLHQFDVSPPPNSSLPVFFAYESPTITPLYEHSSGGAAANKLEMAEHVGSHVDAPYHFYPNGKTIDDVPADALLLCPYKKFDLTENNHQPGELVELEHLAAASERGDFDLQDGDVAVLEFGWDRHLPDGPDRRPPDWWGRDQPGLSDEACRYLTTAGISAVACDTAACDVATFDGQIISGRGHAQHFLPNGILIVEGLRGLASVPTTGLFLALPLKITGGTGSPVRVLLFGS